MTPTTIRCWPSSIAHGATREEARRRLVQALGDTTALGIATNRAFPDRLPEHPRVRCRPGDDEFIPSTSPRSATPAPDDAARALAAVLWFEASARRAWSRSRARLVLERRARLAARARGRRKPTRRAITVLGPRRYRIEGGEAPGEVQIAAAEGRSGEVASSTDGNGGRNSPSPATACISSSGPATSPCARRSTTARHGGAGGGRRRSCVRP